MMKVVPYEKALYPMLAEWWEGHEDWEAIPECFLPAIGFLVIEDREYVAAGFMYYDPTAKLGQMEWIVTRPGLGPKLALKSIKAVVERLTREADMLHIALFTSLKNERLEHLYEQYGFFESERGAINMIRAPRKKEGD